MKNVLLEEHYAKQRRATRIVTSVLLLMALAMLTSCETIQTGLHYASGGLVPLPTPASKAAGAQVWTAWLTWIGTMFGIEDPQAATAVTVAAYSRVDNAWKGLKATARGVKRVATRRKTKKPKPPVGTD